MRHGADWYKRDPLAYLGGVQGMTAAHHAVFSVVLDLIYAHGGAVNNDPKWISGWISDMGAAAVRKALADLIGMGKLALDDDGKITQKRAKTEAKTRENLRETAAENGKKGGKKSAELRAEAKKANDLGQATASSENQAEKIRGDKRRKEEPPLPPKGGGSVAIVPASQHLPSNPDDAQTRAEFERVWPHYPRHVGKGAAEAAWRKARRGTPYDDIAKPLWEFIRCVKGTPIDKVPHFATWLNQRRWEDEQAHAANRQRTSTEDLEDLANVREPGSSRDDLDRLFHGIPHLRIAQ